MVKVLYIPASSGPGRTIDVDMEDDVSISDALGGGYFEVFCSVPIGGELCMLWFSENPGGKEINQVVSKLVDSRIFMRDQLRGAVLVSGTPRCSQGLSEKVTAVPDVVVVKLKTSECA